MWDGGGASGAGSYGTEGVVFTLAVVRGCTEGDTVTYDDGAFACVEEIV